MKNLILLMLLPFSAVAIHALDLQQIRKLYQTAADVKQDASQLNKLMSQVDSSALPVMVCYKGANEMIQAKYAINPITKLNKFKRGKDLIQEAFSRDTLNLEMHFIRYAIQSNLPAFLDYHNEINKDKRYLLENTKANKDAELQEMIFNYFSGLATIKSEELKQLKN